MHKESKTISYLYWIVPLIMLFTGIRNSGLVLIIGSKILGSQLMRNVLNLPRQYSKHQTKAEEIEKCLDESFGQLIISVSFTMQEAKTIFGMYLENKLF